MIWRLSHRCDTEARLIADRHYNRQSIGACNFVPPGRCLVLLAPQALWVTSWPFAEYVRHAWAGAWVCSCFRREGGDMLASEMIRQAVAVTRFRYGNPPELGMITFLDRSKVKPVMVRGVATWGRTWIIAGFEHVGETKGGLMAFQLKPENMPAAESYIDNQYKLPLEITA